jgi:hypothetical protein
MAGSFSKQLWNAGARAALDVVARGAMAKTQEPERERKSGDY